MKSKDDVAFNSLFSRFWKHLQDRGCKRALDTRESLSLIEIAQDPVQFREGQNRGVLEGSRLLVICLDSES